MPDAPTLAARLPLHRRDEGGDDLAAGQSRTASPGLALAFEGAALLQRPAYRGPASGTGYRPSAGTGGGRYRAAARSWPAASVPPADAGLPGADGRASLRRRLVPRHLGLPSSGAG